MRADVVRLLVCPHCGSVFSLAERALRCAAGHSFDIARQGYVNLLPGDSRSGTGDTAPMVRARRAFLEAGHFSRLRDAVAEAAGRAVLEAGSRPPPAEAEPDSAGAIIDVGAGTGYYLAGVLDRLPDRIGLALDLSRFALRRAARAHERMGAAACDTWRRLPVHDNCAVLVLDVFAPRNPPEFRRILEPEGRLLIVTPTNRHLRELTPLLGMLGVDTRKQDRLDAKVSGHFALVALTD
jgi:23S rRNA (guanine745-N1)-methyltransferase